MRSCTRINNSKPFVQCQQCKTVLEHPVITQEGLSTILRHTFTDDCKRTARQKRKTNLNFFKNIKKIFRLLLQDYYKDYYKINF